MRYTVNPPSDPENGVYTQRVEFGSGVVLDVRSLQPLPEKTVTPFTEWCEEDLKYLGIEEFRPFQEEALQLCTFISKTTPQCRIYLSAPTGSGKSIIAQGFIAAHDPLNMPGLILTADHGLQEQYAEQNIPSITGRSNWPCLLDPKRTVDKADCARGLFKPTQCDMYEYCPYFTQRNSGWEADYCVTNYHYVLQSTGRLPKRAIVADEAHQVEPILRALQTITLDMKAVGPDEVGVAQDFKSKLDTYRDHLSKELASLDGEDDFVKLQHTIAKEKLRKVDRVLALIDRYGELARVIRPTFGKNQARRSTFFTPIGGMSYLKHSGPILATSATLCDPFLLEKLDAERSSTVDEGVAIYYIEVPSTFPPQNRPIIPLNVTKVGRKMTELDMRQLVWNIDRLLERHGDTKGVVHSVSYDLARKIKDMSDYPMLLITHGSGGRDDAIEEFKDAPPGRVLLSPAVATGVDLPYDLCRWQIIAKLPFPYMGDKMVKIRMEEFPELSSLDTAQTIVQMAGRGMRAADDHCETYILDANWRWFYGANWKLFPLWFRQAILKGGDNQR